MEKVELKMQELTEKLCEGDQASIREALEGFNVKVTCSIY